MQRLINGFRQFHETYFQENRGMFDLLAQGQAPKAMVISCCDSRVDPGFIFNSVPGEVFVLRNIANLVPPYSPDDHYHGTSAAIEFAVCSLAVETIVVLGHARCGGITALLGDYSGDFIGPWMSIAEPARVEVLECAGDQPKDVQQQMCEFAALKISLGNLRTFPWLREREEAGKLALQAWYFDIEKGALLTLDEPSGEFIRQM